MKNNNWLLSILILCFILSCSSNDNDPNEKQEIQKKIMVYTSPMFTVGKGTVDVSGKILGGTDIIKEVGFAYSLKNNLPLISDNKKRAFVEGVFFKETLNDLENNKKYFIRSYASSEKNTVYGEVIEAIPGIPIIISTTNGIRTSVNKAVLFGKVEDEGNDIIIEKGFLYANHEKPDFNDSKVKETVNIDDLGDYSCEINIDADLSYYAKAYAINKTDTAYGKTIEVKSGISTLPVKNVVKIAAIVCGKLDLSSSDDFGVCWSTNPNPTIEENKIQATNTSDGTNGYDENVFGVFIDNLEPETNYYAKSYTVFPNNIVVYGNEVSFKTTKGGSYSYTNNVPKDKTDAYRRITLAMDSSMYYFNNYTNSGKHFWANYAEGTPTADCNIEGWIRFGKNERYQWVGTAQHEMNHGMGVGTTWQWRDLVQANGVKKWSREVACYTLGVMMKDMTQVLKGDSQHYWPGGINQREEVTQGQTNSLGVTIKNEDMLKANVMILNAMHIDGLPIW